MQPEGTETIKIEEQDAKRKFDSLLAVQGVAFELMPFVWSLTQGSSPN